MVKLYDEGIYLVNGTEIVPESEGAKVQALTGKAADKETAKKGTMACSILSAHNTSGDMEHLKLKFDAMTSHDITFVGVIQTAKASGMEKFPVPYVLTNCHNSLCAVGGTINEDDHMFGLSAAKKYGGIYVPPHIAVMHQYMREMHAGCGRMILGSDSHTRYGALGTMAIGEGGGELVKQLLCDTYDVVYPGVVAIYLTGKPGPGIGPQDVALSIIGAVFKKGYVKNKVMEFVGPGVASMTTDYRNGVDVMTTETTCLTSIWRTDEDTKAFLTAHGRGDDYKELNPADVAYYDGCVYVDLSTIKPMIALPFHPSNTYEIDELNANLGDILRSVEKEAEKVSGGRAPFTLTDKIENGRLRVQQGIIAGCAGGNFTNVVEAAHALKGKSCGDGEFSLAVYPSSQPVFIDLVRKGFIAELMEAGAVIRTAFCGPCFGAGDTPCNNGLSIRHTTRNFPNREGSKPGNGQMSAVALMSPLTDNILLKVCSKIMDEVTTTDELIPSGETSSYRSNPLGLAEFTLSRRDPEYVGKSKAVDKLEKARTAGQNPSELDADLNGVFDAIHTISGQENVNEMETEIGSMIYAVKPGDGSAREQAASCQRVIGGLANITKEYATKRYRSNVMNWGMIPFQMVEEPEFEVGDYIYVPGAKAALDGDLKDIKAYVINADTKAVKEISLYVADMTADERKIVKAGCLINYNRARKGLK